MFRECQECLLPSYKGYTKNSATKYVEQLNYAQNLYQIYYAVDGTYHFQKLSNGIYVALYFSI